MIYNRSNILFHRSSPSGEAPAGPTPPAPPPPHPPPASLPPALLLFSEILDGPHRVGSKWVSLYYLVVASAPMSGFVSKISRQCGCTRALNAWWPLGCWSRLHHCAQCLVAGACCPCVLFCLSLCFVSLLAGCVRCVSVFVGSGPKRSMKKSKRHRAIAPAAWEAVEVWVSSGRLWRSSGRP